MTYGSMKVLSKIGMRRATTAAGMLCAMTIAYLLPPAASPASAGWDFSVSGFAGYSVPFKTDITQQGPATDLTGKDASLESSLAYGGKITAWTTAPRKRWGFDLGAELDITRFSPSIKQQNVQTTGRLLGIPVSSQSLNHNDLNSTIFAVNLLLRKPFGVRKDLPMGRWYPYLGIGAGIQRTTAEARTFEDTDTAFVFQVPVGAKVFLTRHVALFGEYKYTRASHTFTTGPNVTNEMTIATNLFLGGIAIHFN